MSAKSQQKWDSVDVGFGYRYDLQYDTANPRPRPVEQYSVSDLCERYLNILWEDGSHKYNVIVPRRDRRNIAGTAFSGFPRRCSTKSSVPFANAETAMRPSIERWPHSASCCGRRTRWAISTVCRNSDVRRSEPVAFASSNTTRRNGCFGYSRALGGLLSPQHLPCRYRCPARRGHRPQLERSAGQPRDLLDHQVGPKPDRAPYEARPRRDHHPRNLFSGSLRHELPGAAIARSGMKRRPR